MKIIDYSIIEGNIDRILKTNDLYVVLKNNAYEFNMDKILNITEKKNIKGYFINTINEAKDLRAKTNKQIYLMGNYSKYIDDIKKYDVIPTASSLYEMKKYNEEKIKYALKINVGMNRFGINKIIDDILEDNYLSLIYAHFPVYDDASLDKIKIIQALASKYNKDYCVGGSILYNKTNSPLRLGYEIYRNSLSFYGKIISIREISANDYVGYLKEYKSTKKEKIAILDVGYYNGIRVGFNGNVYYKNRLYRVIGRICMNHTFIYADDEMKEGEYVEFISSNIPINNFIKANNSTEYESFLSLK